MNSLLMSEPCLIFPDFLFRYHGDERLLPEYSSSMTDSVKVVELSGHNGRNVPEGSDLESSQSSTFLPDYYMEEDSEMVSKYLINLRAGISL